MPLRRPNPNQSRDSPIYNITYSRFNLFTNLYTVRRLRHAIFDQPRPFSVRPFYHEDVVGGHTRAFLTYYTEQVIRSVHRYRSLHPTALAFIPEQFRGLVFYFILVLEQAYATTGNILRRKPIGTSIHISFTIDALDSSRKSTLGRSYKRSLQEDTWDIWVRHLIDAIELSDDHDNNLQFVSQSGEEFDWQNARIVGQWREERTLHQQSIPMTRSILAGGKLSQTDQLYKKSIGPLDYAIQGLNAFDPTSVFPDRQPIPEYSMACAHICFIIAFSPYLSILFNREDWDLPSPSTRLEYNRVYSVKHLVRNKNNMLFRLIDYFTMVTDQAPYTWVVLATLMEVFLKLFPGHRILILDPKDKTIRFACQGLPLSDTLHYEHTHFFLYKQQHLNADGTQEKGHLYHYKPPSDIKDRCPDCLQTACHPDHLCDFWLSLPPLKAYQHFPHIDPQLPELPSFENDITCNHCDKIIGPEKDQDTGLYKVLTSHIRCPIQKPDINPLKECQQMKYDPYPMSIHDPKMTFQRNENSKGKRLKQPVTFHAWDMECMIRPTTIHRLRNQQRRYLSEQNFEGEVCLEPEPIPEDDEVIHEHIPNFIHVQTLFTDNVRLQPTHTRPPPQHSHDFNTIQEFVQFLKRASRPGATVFPSKTKHVFIAHNSKGYDARLLYIALLPHLSPDMLLRKPIKRGSKFLRLELYFPAMQTTLIFMDSMCHITQSLDGMSKSLGVKVGNMKKGDFPHAFNTIENQDYVGSLPDIVFYEHGERSPEKKAAFEETYITLQQEAGQSWCLQTELKAYCRQDVTILRLCMEKYYRLFYEETGLNPLLCTTAPAFALKSYMHCHMPYGKLMVLDPKFLDHARRALRGGRTDVRKRYHKMSPADLLRSCCIRYQDVQSLYPYVMFAKTYPTGTPQRYDYGEKQGTPLQNIPDNDKFKQLFQNMPDSFDRFFMGFITCDIKCTNYIHHPVVVHNKPNGRLVANYHDIQNITLTSVELYHALKTKCYEVSKVYIIDKYDATPGLFSSYIKTWLKKKLETSTHDFQKGEKTEDQRRIEFQRLHDDTLRVTGIDLKYEDMIPNPGMKTIAKLMLNSLWGKLGQKPDARETIFTDLDKEKMEEYIQFGFIKRTSASHYDSLGSSQQNNTVTYDIQDYRFLSQTSSVPVAAFVAAYGRIELWMKLNKLGKRVLYHDTDSILYIYDPELYNIPVENVLGGWELETHSPITEFVGVAPKTYGFRIQEGSSVQDTIKCKGFPLNWNSTMDEQNANRINFDSYKSLVFSNDPKKYLLTAPGTYFEFSLQFQFMGTTKRQKKLTGAYEKGVVCPSTFHTYGEGWDRWGTISFAELDDSPRPC